MRRIPTRAPTGGTRVALVVSLVSLAAIGLCLIGLLLLFCTRPRRTSRAVRAGERAAPEAGTLAMPLTRLPAPPKQREVAGAASRSSAPSVERDALLGPPPTRPAQGGQIIGRVWLHLPWIPSDLLLGISSSRTPDECSALLAELEPTVVGRLPVQLRGDTLHDQVLSDDQGYFRFESLVPGTYEFSAELPLTNPWTGGSTVLRSSSQVHLETGAEAARLDLRLRENVTIRGRVQDSLGAPIAGVTVEGRAVPIERHDLPGDGVDSPFTVRAETDSSGEYVLSGFPPPPIYHAAAFLLGVCNEVGMEHVAVGVSDPRFEVTNATRVILMTEALSNAAAPLAEVLRALPASVEFPMRRPGTDASMVKLYSSQSNEILGVDIVAEPRR